MAAGKVDLILDYRVQATCAIYPNYPKSGVTHNPAWRITRDTVGWRYNVNSTWAMVSDKKYRRTHHVCWGFVHRSCIGTSRGGEHFPTPTSDYPAGARIPNRILQGRSALTRSHYRSVDFSPAAARVVNPHKRVKSFGTLRDAPGRFAIGNVYGGWYVRATSARDGSWTKVYVPYAHRWGWIENIHF